MFFRSPEVFRKKGVLRDFGRFAIKHLCQGLFINKVAGQGRQLYLKMDPGTGVSCEFCEISKNTFFLQDTSGGFFQFFKIEMLLQFPDIHQKMSVLKSLYNTVSGLKPSNFNKKVFL